MAVARSVLALLVLVLVAVGLGWSFLNATILMPALDGTAPETAINVIGTVHTTLRASPVDNAIYLTGVLCAGLVCLYLPLVRQPAAWLIFVGIAVFVFGVLLVTDQWIIPMDSAIDPGGPQTVPSAAWLDYRSQWSFWDRVRTTSSVVALVCIALALRLEGREGRGRPRP